MSEDKRSHKWLNQTLNTIWETHFHDVARLNAVTILWSRRNRNRLGAIIAKGGEPKKPEKSEIRINSLMRNRQIPESVVIQTIAHELTHYAHGFCSPHPQKHLYPHQGKVVEIELKTRGLEEVYNEAETWLKTHWRGHVHDALGAPRRRKYAPFQPKMSFLQNFPKISVSRRRLGR